MPIFRGTRYVLLAGARAVAYLLRATFYADDQGYADGQVLDTVAEGVSDGQLTVIEIDGTLSISGNKCVFTAQTTPVFGALGLYSQAIARVLGRGLLITINANTANKSGRMLVLSTGANITDAAVETGFYFRWNANIYNLVVGSSTQDILCAYSASTDYQLALILGGYSNNGVPWRSGQAAASYLYGTAFYIKGGAFTDWTLLWRIDAGNTATLYVTLSLLDIAGTLDDLRIPGLDLSAVLQPTCLSTFTGDNATDLDALIPEVGGTWTEQSGDWEVSANQIVPTADNTEHIATVDSGIADAIIDCAVEISTDTGGLEHGIILRYSDTSTYWKVSINATNNDVGIWEINSGITERANGAVTINTGIDYDVRAIAYGQTIDAFIDGGNKISYGSAANNENETEHGLYTYFNAAQDLADFDNFAAFSRTSSVYESTLDSV